MLGGEHSCKNVSSPALRVWDRQCLGDSEQKDHLMNELIIHEGVYITAAATPGLLMIQKVNAIF